MHADSKAPRALGPDLRGAVMVCGTASDVGKSRLVTGLCRALARHGVRVAPFKAQNMALNSFVTADGAEIGRSQAAQAMAAGIEPEAVMNPILLKPTGETRSQVVVMGRAGDDVDFAGYRARHRRLRAVVDDSLADLRARVDVVLCEGAGGAAEINLLDRDLANLPLAAAAGMGALLVGDIERGGVFASLFGTVALLPPRYRRTVQGFVINKFRGEAAFLGPGIAALERRTGIRTLGVVPFVDGLGLDAEDSLALGAAFAVGAPSAAPQGPLGPRPAGDTLDVAVVRLPRIANFTDLDPLALEPDVSVRLVSAPRWGDPDVIVVPGTKSTIADLAWMRERGLDRALRAAAAKPGGPIVLGICGGYQMLGRGIHDTVESGAGRSRGLGLLTVDTEFALAKITRRRRGRALGRPLTGYEIHHGLTRRTGEDSGWLRLEDANGVEEEGCTNGPVPGRTGDGRAASVWGTSLHGLFEADGFRRAFLAMVARRRGKRFRPGTRSFADARQEQFDRLADLVEAHLDLRAFARIVSASDAHPGRDPR